MRPALETVSCVYFTTPFPRHFTFYDYWGRETDGDRLSEKLTRAFLVVGCRLCFERLPVPRADVFDAEGLCWLPLRLKSRRLLRFAELDRSFLRLLEVFRGTWRVLTDKKTGLSFETSHCRAR